MQTIDEYMQNELFSRAEQVFIVSAWMRFNDAVSARHIGDWPQWFRETIAHFPSEQHIKLHMAVYWCIGGEILANQFQRMILRECEPEEFADFIVRIVRNA